jgi:hypothetical protein
MTVSLVRSTRNVNVCFTNSLAPYRYNESLRLSERRRHFDIHALCQVVSKSVNRPKDAITTFVKIAEGGSYRAFEATFWDGMNVIVRLPYPSTVPRKYGVASEVTTMDFLRLHGVPIPKVYWWSSSTSNEGREVKVAVPCRPSPEYYYLW